MFKRYLRNRRPHKSSSLRDRGAAEAISEFGDRHGGLRPPRDDKGYNWSLAMTINIFVLIFILSPQPSQAAPEPLSDEAFLELIQRKSFDYFIQESNPVNGLIRDRAPNARTGTSRAPAAIAGVGFALTAYGVAVERRWMDRATALEKTRRTLEFFWKHAQQEHGFFFHFLDMQTGERSIQSEVSPIDTALFLAGALFATEYFQDEQIRSLTNQIYERVDWKWLLRDGKTLTMAWSPETGFTRHKWNHYNEGLILYLLAIASPSHPIPAESWQHLVRSSGSYGNHRLIASPPLFTHQYSHIWIDFRDKNDGFADYFKNSVEATLANRQFCMDQAAKYKTYGPDSWGLTASDGPTGYRAYGSPPGFAHHDGTVAPTACGSSIVFTPKESLRCLRHLYEHHYNKLWGRYGFSDAFNLDRDWFSQEVLAIDQGPLLLMIENHRSGLIWKVMQQNSALQKAMKAVGFKPDTMEMPWPAPPEFPAFYADGRIEVDGYLRDWPNGIGFSVESLRGKRSQKEQHDFKSEIRFAWDANALYFFIRVRDDFLMARTRGKNIWQDDLLEIYADPDQDLFEWDNPKDLQIGFRPTPRESTVGVWSWTKQEDPSAHGDVQAFGYVHQTGYLIEAAISWNYFGFRPQPGMKIALSPSFHDMDRDRSEDKWDWFFRSEQGYKQFRLGTITLEPRASLKPRVTVTEKQ